MITDYTNYSGYTNNNLGYIKKNSSFSSSKENPFKKANEELLALKNKAFKKTSESVLCNNSEINQFPKVPEYIKNNRDLYLGWLGDISHDPKYSKEVRDTALNKFNDLAKKNTQAENSIINSANDWINAANEGERNTIVGCTTAIATVIGLYAAAPAIASLGPFLSAAAKEALSTCNNIQIGLSQSGQPMLAPAGGGAIGSGGGSIALNDAMIKSLVASGVITVAVAQKLKPAMMKSNETSATNTSSQNKPPKDLVENPNRKGSFGKFENGKFKEYWRFDKGTPGSPGWRGKDHIHIDGGPHIEVK
jgi:hypothetical protein